MDEVLARQVVQPRHEVFKYVHEQVRDLAEEVAEEAPWVAGEDNEVWNGTLD